MATSDSIQLARLDGSTYLYTPLGNPVATTPKASFQKRIAFAAAHVVVDPLRTAGEARGRRKPRVRRFDDDAVVQRRAANWGQPLRRDDNREAECESEQAEPAAPHQIHQVARSATTCAAAGAAEPPNQSRSPPKMRPTPTSSGTTDQP